VVSTLTHTYAPKGQTPVITTSTEINLRLYVASAISPAGDLQYMIRKQPFDSEAIISYLEHLQQAFARRKLLIIRDNASIHDSDKVRTYLSTQKSKRLHLARQPLYSRISMRMNRCGVISNNINFKTPVTRQQPCYIKKSLKA